jgi:hypothetical protein
MEVDEDLFELTAADFKVLDESRRRREEQARTHARARTRTHTYTIHTYCIPPRGEGAFRPDSPAPRPTGVPHADVVRSLAIMCGSVVIAFKPVEDTRAFKLVESALTTVGPPEQEDAGH